MTSMTRLARAAALASALVPTGCIAGSPDAPPDPGLLPERITVLSVEARTVREGSADRGVLLTFRVRNDAARTAERISLRVAAFRGSEQIGEAPSHDNPGLPVGRDTTIGVHLERPSRLEELECYEYRVETLIGPIPSVTPPVRRCVR